MNNDRLGALLAAPMLLTSIVLSGCQVGPDDGASSAAAISDTLSGTSSKFWTTSEVPVCWLNPTNENAAGRAASQDAVAQSWEAVLQIRFTGWGACASDHDSGIRIQADDSWPRSRVGTDANRSSGPSMWLNFGFACGGGSQDTCIRAVAAHEFGHALGFHHEHDRSDNPGTCAKDTVDVGGDRLLGAYDPASIMNACSTAGYDNGGRLSDGDIAGAQEVYGVRDGYVDRCPNGIVDPGEQCDDGNTDDTDGCTNQCQVVRVKAQVCLLVWAEVRYPELFAGGGDFLDGNAFMYRYYSRTNTYLGFSANDHHAYMLDSVHGMQDLGPASKWAAEAKPWLDQTHCYQ